MKVQHLIFASAAVACFGASLLAADSPISGAKRKSLSVTTKDVLLVQSTSGAAAVIQFTSLNEDAASYRWRYRPAKGQSPTSGKGQVRESYDRKEKADGSYQVTPKADHDTTVRAGDITVEWSYGSLTNGWLYYRPSRVTIQVLSSSAFDKDF
jgi:hypothetical protein